MDSLHNILPTTIKKLGIKRKFGAEAAILHWKDIVGSKIASHAWPVLVERELMFIAVNNSVWGHHLSTMKQDIITKINNFVGEKVINDIRFQAGYLKNGQNEDNTAETSTIPISSIRLDEDEISMVHSIADSVTDSELRQKFQSLIAKDLALKKLRRNSKWNNCSQCGALCPPDKQYCLACSVKKKQMIKDEVHRMLLEAPWLTYDEMNQMLDCNETDYREIKHAIKAALMVELSSGGNSRVKTLTLVMLSTGAKPDEITDKLIQNTIARLGGKKHVSTSGG